MRDEQGLAMWKVLAERVWSEFRSDSSDELIPYYPEQRVERPLVGLSGKLVNML